MLGKGFFQNKSKMMTIMMIVTLLYVKICDEITMKVWLSDIHIWFTDYNVWCAP